MRPPMKQLVTAHVPVIGVDGKPIKDKYGKPKTEQKTSKARVQFKSQVVMDTQGIERKVDVEIDIPSKFNPPVGSSIEYVTAGGDTGSGTIQAKEEITNLTGSKVYYRTVFVDG